MEDKELNFEVSSLGECCIPSPMKGVHFVNKEAHVLFHHHLREINAFLEAGKRPCASKWQGRGRRSTLIHQNSSAGL